MGIILIYFFLSRNRRSITHSIFVIRPLICRIQYEVKWYWFTGFGRTDAKFYVYCIGWCNENGNRWQNKCFEHQVPKPEYFRGTRSHSWLLLRLYRCPDIRENTWGRHQMETFSVLLAICAGNSPVPGEFPTQIPVTRSFDVFFDLRLNKWLSKQSWGWWFETLPRPLWRLSNDKYIVAFSESDLNCEKN